MRLKQAAGWNQVESDWQTVMRVSPDGCWVFEADGRAVGSATAVAFGKDLAWIGMVLVLPEYRRRGIARQLMETAVRWCEARGVAAIKLDATDLGRPLYRSMGFVDEEPIERWGRDPGEVAGSLASGGAIDWDLDRRGFGCDRRLMLDALAAAPDADLLAADGVFGMSRPGSNARFLGPVIGESRDATARVIRGLLAAHADTPWFWDLLPESGPAASLAEELGFRRLRSLTRMSRPAPRAFGDPALVWATAGFEYG